MATIKRSKKRFIVPICIILVLAIAGGATAGAIVKSRKSVTKLYTISSGDISENVTLTGDVTSGSVKEYKVGGVATVKEVFVEVGDEVKSGDELATFDVSDLSTQIATLQSSYDNAVLSYNATKQSYDNAKVMLDKLDDMIADLEDEIAAIQNGEYVPETTSKKPTQSHSYSTPTRSSTSTTKKERTTKEESSSDDNSSSNNSSGTSSGGGGIPNINTIAEALEELNQTLVAISADLDTIAEMSAVISEALAEAIDSGALDSDVIAAKVGDAIAGAIIDGMIDSAMLMVDSGAAVDMIEAAVSSVDFDAIGNAVANSENFVLTTDEIQLASLMAQRGIFKVQADPSLLNAQRVAMNSTKLALDTLKEQKAEMDEGWKAAFDGVITKVDIQPDTQTNLLSAGITLENLDNMTATVSLSEYDVHKVKKGMSATIKTVYGTYDGEVVSVAPTATGGSESSVLDSVGSQMGISGLSSLTSQSAGVECKVAIYNTDENIIPGFSADVEIKTGQFDGVPVVPIESIVLEKEGTFVYLYDETDGTVTKTRIETGAVSDSAYEVKSGLKVGDRIIATPSTDYEEETFKINVE